MSDDASPWNPPDPSLLRAEVTSVDDEYCTISTEGYLADIVRAVETARRANGDAESLLVPARFRVKRRLIDAVLKQCQARYDVHHGIASPEALDSLKEATDEAAIAMDKHAVLTSRVVATWPGHPMTLEIERMHRESKATLDDLKATIARLQKQAKTAKEVTNV